MKLNDLSVFISCPKGIESLLLKEVQEITGIKAKEEYCGVDLRCTLEQLNELIFSSRLASRIFLYLDNFFYRHENELYKRLKKIDWEQYQTVDQTFRCQCNFGRGVKLKNSQFVSLKLKDSIVDFFRAKYDKRPSVDKNMASMPYYLRVEKSRAFLYLDCSGFPLSNRGYRVSKFSAPLRENLAAALILSTNWRSREKSCFIDGMCGSATALIEAALIKLNIIPGYLNLPGIINKRVSYPLANLKSMTGVQTEIYSQLKMMDDKALDQLRKAKDAKVFMLGNDLSGKSLKSARENVEASGLSKVLTLKKGDVTELIPAHHQGTVFFCNPPYGQRLGEEEELGELYYQIGENLKQNFKDCDAYIFTANADLRKKISLKTSKRAIFHNGQLESRLLHYEIY